MAWDDDAYYETELEIPSGRYGKLLAMPGGVGPAGPVGEKGDVGEPGPIGPQGLPGVAGISVDPENATTVGSDGLVFTRSSAVGRSVLTAVDGKAGRLALDAAQTTGHVDIRDHGGVGDGVALTDAVTAAGSAVLTSASGRFTADMVGKTVVVMNATASYTTLVTTVASYQSPTQITMATAAGKVNPIYGGPNVNAIVGTDNSAAFAAAFAEAAAGPGAVEGSVSYGNYNKLYAPTKPVFVPGGAYLTLTGVPTLQERGHALFGESQQSTLIWHVGAGPFLEMGDFNPNPSDNPYYGTAPNLKISNLTLCAPVTVVTDPAKQRVGIGVQDNGCGHLSIEHVYMYNFDYGVFATCGSDFSEFGGSTSIMSCNVGVYLGPESQQCTFRGVMFDANREGLVIEGSPQGTVVGCAFGRSAVADVVFEGVTSGLTRGGMPNDLGSSMYIGPWAFYNTWFESFSSGASSGNQHIWIKSAKGAAQNIPNGWQGLSFRDCLLISGGTQTVGGTVAFIHDQGPNASDPLVSNLVVLGKRINGIYRYSGPAATFSPVLDYYAWSNNDIVPFIGPAGTAVPVGTTLPGVITSPSTLALSNANLVGTTVRGAEIVSTTETQELFNKTLNRPKVLNLHNVATTNNVPVINLGGPTTAANHFQINNAGAGSGPTLFGMGSDANVPIMLRPKGTAPVQVYADTGATAARIVATSGTVLDLSLNLETKMAGVVQANGTQVEVKGHTHTVAQVTGAESTANKNAANGYCPLDAASKVPVANLPARWVAVPASATAPGAAGDVAYNATHMFVCVAANTWTWVKLTNTWPPA
jgi:hypothetical protein